VSLTGGAVASMLEIRDLSKRYGKTVAAKNVSLSLGKGEFFCLLGPSGCGKSTILRMIGGFEKPDEGRILLDGVDITDLPPYQRDVNTVFQSYALFPNMSVLGNVAYGLKVRKVAPAEVRERTEQVIAMVGLRGLEGRLPAQLSGGQQQRVALARALVNRPTVLLLDEPMSALDKKIAEQTRAELAELQREVGITFVFVTHNQTEALAMADRLAVMNEGVIEQCGAPREIYESPETRFVADFIGSMNFFNGVVAATDDQGCALTLLGDVPARLQKPSALRPGEACIFLIRPERLRLSVADPREYENALTGTIEGSVYMGDTTHYRIGLRSGKTVSVHVQNYLPGMTDGFYELGEEINIVWSQTSGGVIRA
jgi:spermidine/putrescine ABC transporter ATP-binding subunit